MHRHAIGSIACGCHLRAAHEKGRFVFLCGNGGSGSNASHFCEDMGKGTILRQDFDNDAKKRLKILSLTDNTPYILAWANDEGFDRVFVEQLKNLASPGDLLIAISGSGNSPNILKAVEWANRHDITTAGCTGFKILGLLLNRCPDNRRNNFLSCSTKRDQRSSWGILAICSSRSVVRTNGPNIAEGGRVGQPARHHDLRLHRLHRAASCKHLPITLSMCRWMTWGSSRPIFTLPLSIGLSITFTRLHFTLVPHASGN